MNWTNQSIFSLTVICLSGWLTITPNAIAQCVQADVSVQYNISGSHQPTERHNQVEMQSPASCQGNVSVTTGVQGNEGGTGKVVQNRVVRHRFEDNPHSSSGGSTVQIRSNPAIDVYNAAEQLKH